MWPPHTTATVQSVFYTQCQVCVENVNSTSTLSAVSSAKLEKKNSTISINFPAPFIGGLIVLGSMLSSHSNCGTKDGPKAGC